MRYYEFKLNEGAIDVSNIVNDAEALLQSTFLSLIKDDAKKWVFTSEYRHKKKYGSLDGFDSYLKRNDAEESYKAELARGFSGAWACVYKSSKVLTTFLQEKLLESYGTSQDGSGTPDGLLIDSTFYPIGNIKVVVNQHKLENEKADGLMHRSAYGKTFHMHSDEVKKHKSDKFTGVSIHVDKELWLDNYNMALFSEIYFLCNEKYDDEGPEYYIDRMIEQIIGTFSHEVDHIIFYIKKHKGTDRTRITTGRGRDKVDNIKKGKKYYSHSAGDTNIQYARYLASDIEMQAWATDAATSLIRRYVKFHTKPWSANQNTEIEKDPKVWNSYIDGIIKDLQAGKFYNSNGLHTYADIMKKRNIKDKDENGNEPDISVNDKEFKITWQRFLKLLVLKLQAYKKPV